MLGSAESERPTLTNCEIIFDEFQLMAYAITYLNVTDRLLAVATGEIAISDVG